MSNAQPHAQHVRMAIVSPNNFVRFTRIGKLSRLRPRAVHTHFISASTGCPQLAVDNVSSRLHAAVAQCPEQVSGAIEVFGELAFDGPRFAFEL